MLFILGFLCGIFISHFSAIAKTANHILKHPVSLDDYIKETEMYTYQKALFILGKFFIADTGELLKFDKKPTTTEKKKIKKRG